VKTEDASSRTKISQSLYRRTNLPALAQGVFLALKKGYAFMPCL